MKVKVSRGAWVAAFSIAICADAVEICLSPVFSEGFASPFDNVLDVVVCVLLSVLVGWHLAFLPSFAVKLIPVADIAPTWTLAVLIAARSRRATGAVSDNAGAQPPPIVQEEKRPGALPENRN